MLTETNNQIKWAILFFFYKNVSICKNRLKLLKKLNPDVCIYGLYGGYVKEAEYYRKNLSKYLDDFYCFPEEKDSHWKWINGDLLILDWYKKRGRGLDWDTIFIAQWDMLVMACVKKLFPKMKKGDVYLSGTRPVNEVYNWWYWTQPSNVETNKKYHDFIHYITKQYNCSIEPLCCQFLIVCLPLEFLEKYCSIQNPELGFEEYRLPTYAKLFGFKFYQTDMFTCWWPRDPEIKNIPRRHRVLNAEKWEVVYLRTIIWHLLQRNGTRVFHPYQEYYPYDLHSSYLLLKKKLNANCKSCFQSLYRFLRNYHRKLFPKKVINIIHRVKDDYRCDFHRYVPIFGIYKGLVFYIKMIVSDKSLISFSIPEYDNMIYLRPNTSDIEVFQKIFYRKEYDIKINIEPKFIIDAGANVGYASVYFANKYPAALVYAIEPEITNYEVMLKNFSQYSNIKPLRAGLWYRNTQLNIKNSKDEKWGFQLHENTHSEYCVMGKTIQDIMNAAQYDMIDILKIDIEGAEKEIFSHDCSWLNKVNVLVIELHDRLVPGCSEAFYSKIKKYDFREYHIGENIVLVRNNIIERDFNLGSD